MSQIFKEEYKENERYNIFKRVANGEITPQKADDLIIELYDNECKLLILSCTDPLMWYKNKIGKEVEFIKKIDGEDVYISREDAGHTNIIKQWDAVIIPK